MQHLHHRTVASPADPSLLSSSEIKQLKNKSRNNLSLCMTLGALVVSPEGWDEGPAPPGAQPALPSRSTSTSRLRGSALRQLHTGGIGARPPPAAGAGVTDRAVSTGLPHYVTFTSYSLRLYLRNSDLN